MLDKLNALEERFYYLEERLSDPAIISEQKEYAKVNKDYKSLQEIVAVSKEYKEVCLLYTSPSPRDATLSRMPSSA